MADKKSEIINYKAQYDEFVKTLEGKTEEELRALEQEIIAECDTVEKDGAKLEFTLPSTNRKTVFKLICKFLDKGSYQWNYCFGAKALYENWATDKSKVLYPVLDSTLRLLGEMKFTGHEEWSEVCTINEYFDVIRPDYVNATNKVYFCAEKHNAVMNKLGLFAPNGEVNPDGDGAKPSQE